MIASVNFYKHYLGDYGRKTAHLSLNEEGAYRRLLDHYYGTLSPLPNDDTSLLRIARAFTDLEVSAVKSVAKQFFRLDNDGLLHNKRADEEIARWTAQAETNRIIGRKGGRPKIETETDSVSDSITEQEPSPEVRSQKLETIGQNQKPEAVNQKKQKSKESARKRATNGSGAHVWEAYATAYASRYGTPPVRNARVNSQISQFVDRVGADDAPLIAVWYVHSGNDYYEKRGHSIGILLADAEKVATEWRTGRDSVSMSKSDRAAQEFLSGKRDPIFANVGALSNAGK